MAAMSYVTVPNRPLLSVGTWNASTGEEVITEGDLAEIVRASQAGVLDAAVIKKGHVDKNYSEFNEDGSPAFGQVTNLRVVDGTLYGDYVHVPSELADSLSSAYPHVSVELARNVKLRTAQGSVAHAFDCVLTAAALLGATAPAVKGLSQKAYAFSEDAFDYSTVLSESATHFAAKKSGAKATETPAEEPPAEDAPAEEPQVDPAPAEPAAPEVEDAPETAPETAEEAAAEAPEAAQGDDTDDTGNISPRTSEIADASPEAPAPTPVPPATPADPNGVPPVNIDEQAAELRKKYDLPDNASYKDLLSKVLDEKIVAGVNQDPINVVAPGSDELDNEEHAEQIADETQKRQRHNLAEGKPKDQQVKVAPAADAVELDNVFVSKSAFSELMADYEATKAKLAEREAGEIKARRDQLVTSWFRQGLIHKDERSKIREQLDVAEETVVALTTARTPIYSTSELGHAVADDAHFAEGTDETKVAALLEADDALFGA